MLAQHSDYNRSTSNFFRALRLCLAVKSPTSNLKPRTPNLASGFTLIEMVVVGGILAMISVVLTQVVFTATRSNTKVDLTDNIKAEGDFALERMNRVIRGAGSISSACAGAGSDSITVVPLSGASIVFACDSTTERIKMDGNFLTSDTYATICTGGMFVCRQTATIPVQTTVNIQFTMRQKNSALTGAQAASMDFGSIVRLRNTQ